jgi:hypothetical protein
MDALTSAIETPSMQWTLDCFINDFASGKIGSHVTTATTD